MVVTDDRRRIAAADAKLVLRDLFAGVTVVIHLNRLSGHSSWNRVPIDTRVGAVNLWARRRVNTWLHGAEVILESEVIRCIGAAREVSWNHTEFWSSVTSWNLNDLFASLN